MASSDEAAVPLRHGSSLSIDASVAEGTDTRRRSRPTFGRSQSSISDLPDAQPFPSPGLPSPGPLSARSRSVSPSADLARRGSYFSRIRGSYTSLSPDDADIHTLASDSRSFRTFGNEFVSFPQDMHTRLLAEKRSTEVAQWKIHWATPSLMGGLWLAGFIGAIAHHAFYKSLHEKPATNQLLMFRIGTAFAFFVRAMLVASSIFSYRQRIWVIFRNKALTVGAIDALFSATEDLFGFGNLEMWKNSKVSVAMAVSVWLIPIASVISPSALITGIRPLVLESSCSVSSIDFNKEAVYDFRNQTLYPGFSLAFYNTTDVNATKPGWFDYYDQPSKNARRLTTTSAYLRRPAVSNDEANHACGGGWNCTYAIHFKGPGYKCDILANTSNPNDNLLAQFRSPMNLSLMAPYTNIIYSADIDGGEYPNPQVPTNRNGEPIDPSAARNLGVFKAEPELWIGFSVQTGQPWPANSQYAANWSSGVVESKIMRCVHYEVMYSINMTFTEGVQNATVTKREFLEPVVNTTLLSYSDTALDATPEANWVRPETDPKKYKRTTVYHVLGTLARSFLRGTMESTPKYVITRSDISETRLTDSRTAYPSPNLDTGVQTFYEDMILSLLSEPRMVATENKTVSCTKSKFMIVHLYREQGLWIGYAIVAFISFMSLVIGSVSLYHNGVSSDTLFSRIMVTTRNPTIDQLSVGACLGSDPFPKELALTRLRFGVLASRTADLPFDIQEKIEHVGFGTIEEITPLRKGGKYA